LQMSLPYASSAALLAALALCGIVAVLPTAVSSACLDLVSSSTAGDTGEGPTCIEAGDRPGLFAFWCNIAFKATLYPIAILKP